MHLNIKMIIKSKKIAYSAIVSILTLLASSPSFAQEPLWRYLGGNRNPNPGSSGLAAFFQEFDARPDYLSGVAIDGFSGKLIRTRTVGVTTEGKGIVIPNRDDKGNDRVVSSYLIPCKTPGEKVYFVEDKKWGTAPLKQGFIDYICFPGGNY